MAIRRKLPWLCLLCAAALFGLALVLQSSVQVAYQYAVAAPYDPAQYAVLYEEIKADDVVVSTRRQGVRIDAIQMTIYGVDETWSSIRHVTLYDGRMITPRDVKRGLPCIVLSETAARTLFPAGNALGNHIALHGSIFEITGLIRDDHTVGEQDSCIAYVPITCPQLPMDTILCSVPRTHQTGTKALYEHAFRNWLAGGTFHDFHQLVFDAWGLPYLLLLLGTAALLGRFFALWKDWGKKLWAESRKSIQQEYLSALWWKIALCLIPAIMATGLLLTACWGWLKLLTYPLQLFPEYVPENPTQLSAWQKCAEIYMQKMYAGIVCRSREVHALTAVDIITWFASFLSISGLHRLKCCHPVCSGRVSSLH